MSEEFEESTPQSFDISRYLDVVRRRHLIFLTLLLVGWAAVWGSSWLLPVKYKSSTLILVEEPAMPKNYVLPNISDNLQDRLQSITQQILSRTRLLLIIDKLHLYQGRARHALTSDQKVDRMRKDINIELIKDEKTNSITAFKIYFVSPDPHMAQQVTGELTNLFIDENLRVRKQESQNTTQFIESQLATARSNLADQEARVKQFQAEHQGALPSQEAANLQILSGLQSQLQNEQDALNAAKQQSVYHQSLVEQYRSFDSKHRTASGAPSGLEGIDQQLDKLRAKLQELSTRYTDQYPEVQQVKAEIADAEKQRAQIVANLKKGADSKQPTGGEAQEVQDPAQNAPLLQLQSQLQADRTEIANRERAVTSLESRINQYQAMLNSQPAVSQQLADLTRGYEQSQTNYNELLKKGSDSQMATSMEQMQEGERFMMLDPPSLPLRPDSPNRLKMCGIGLGVGAGLGLLIVILQEFFDDCMYSDREIIKMIPVGIISEIPPILNPTDAERERKKILLGWTVAALVLCVILSGSAFSYLHS